MSLGPQRVASLGGKPNLAVPGIQHNDAVLLQAMGIASALCWVFDAVIKEVRHEPALLELNHMDIYVGNLPYTAREEDITSLFENYGPVERVKIITDRDTGQSKGFAFVTLSDQSKLDDAIQALNEFDYNGRALRVNASEPKAPRSGGGGGGYGGGGGGGYKGDRRR